MLKKQIQNIIFELNDKDDTTAFVRERLRTLEREANNDTIGVGHTDTYKDFIANKTHYKAGDRISEDIDCPDLIYDDLDPYINLIRIIRRGNWYDENTLSTSIHFAVSDYLPSNSESELQRVFHYYQNKDNRLSIREIRETKCASSHEKAGLAHNMFKFLGIDSEIVFGIRNSQNHAYNFIYPNGYDGVPILLYDPFFYVTFKNEEKNINLGYLAILTKEEHVALMNHNSLKPELDSTETMFRMLYESSKVLEDTYFFGEEATYTVGMLPEKEKIPN